MNILTQQMWEKKLVLPSLFSLLATVQATTLDFGVIFNFGIGVRKLTWLFSLVRCHISYICTVQYHNLF